MFITMRESGEVLGTVLPKLGFGSWHRAAAASFRRHKQEARSLQLAQLGRGMLLRAAFKEPNVVDVVRPHGQSRTQFNHPAEKAPGF